MTTVELLRHESSASLRTGLHGHVVTSRSRFVIAWATASGWGMCTSCPAPGTTVTGWRVAVRKAHRGIDGAVPDNGALVAMGADDDLDRACGERSADRKRCEWHDRPSPVCRREDDQHEEDPVVRPSAP